jgi:Domain of unknown function (DUF397)
MPEIEGQPEWVKSSLSFANGNCVEVATLPGGEIGVRNSRDIAGTVLRFTPDEWHAFIGGIRNGESDSQTRSWRKSPRHSPNPASRAQIRREVNKTSGRHKRSNAGWPAWLKAATVTVAAAASLATAATQGNHDSGAITDGPPGCVIYTVK